MMMTVMTGLVSAQSSPDLGWSSYDRFFSSSDQACLRQDLLGTGAQLVRTRGNLYMLQNDLEQIHGSRRVVALVNTADEAEEISLPASWLGYDGMMRIRDLTKKADLADNLAITTTVPARGSVVYELNGVRREQMRYEAENAFINGVPDGDVSTFAKKTAASCGMTVTNVGYLSDSDTPDRYVEWRNVYSETGGEYSLTISYFSSSRRSFSLYINDEKIRDFRLVSGSADKPTTQNLNVRLAKGNNVVRLTYFTSAQPSTNIYAPDFDYIEFIPNFNPYSTASSIYYEYGDELMTDVLAHLFNQNGNGSNQDSYQWSDYWDKGSNKGSGNSTIWPQGFGLASLSLMAKCAKGTDRYQFYKDKVDKLSARYPAYITTINGVQGYSVYPNTQHRFTDDNAWAGIGLLESYDLDHSAANLDQAILVANYLVQGGRLLTDTKGGGGMYWQDSPADDTNTFKTKNTANNGPALQIFCRLYEITGEQRFLDYAKMTYDWLSTVLLNPSNYLMWDNIDVTTNNINTYQAPYTTGTMIDGASRIYQVTGETKYKELAEKMAKAAFDRWFENYNSPVLGNQIKLVKTEWNTTADDIVVLMRGFCEHALITGDYTYLNAFGQSLLNIWGERRDAECGLMKTEWKGSAGQTYDNHANRYRGLTQSGYCEMYARAALAMSRRQAIIERQSSTQISHKAISWQGSELVSGTSYYLYNIGAGKFLAEGGEGDTKGTQASLRDVGLDIVIRSRGNRYTMNTKVGEGTNQYLGSDLYLNSASTQWDITPMQLSDGRTAYTISDTKGNIGYCFGDFTHLHRKAEGDNALWLLVTKDEQEQALASATPAEPVDATFYVRDADFGRYNTRESSWVGLGNLTGNVATDSYLCATVTGTGSVIQTIEGVKNGVYRLAYQGAYRYGTMENAAGHRSAGTEKILAEAFANEVSKPLPSILSVGANSLQGNHSYSDSNIYSSAPTTTAQASSFFSNGFYFDILPAVAVTDGQLKIGIRKTASEPNDWCVFDNFRLYYLGDVDLQGIATPRSSQTPADEYWYTLSGTRISAPTKAGVYIHRGQKIVIK